MGRNRAYFWLKGGEYAQTHSFFCNSTKIAHFWINLFFGIYFCVVLEWIGVFVRLFLWWQTCSHLQFLRISFPKFVCTELCMGVVFMRYGTLVEGFGLGAVGLYAKHRRLKIRLPQIHCFQLIHFILLFYYLCLNCVKIKTKFVKIWQKLIDKFNNTFHWLSKQM